MKWHAFTIGEFLLAVITIGIIVTFAWPIIAPRGTVEATKSPCQKNLQQIALGFKQYINDNNERYPLVIVTSGSFDGVPPFGWADALRPYIKDAETYQCPSDTYAANENHTAPGYTDYWYNANFVRKIPRGGKLIMLGANESMLGSSAQTVIAGDGGNTNGAPTGDARHNQCGDGTSVFLNNQTCTVAKAGFASYPAAQLHLDGANFAYADGHVKWLRGNSPTQSVQVLSNGMTQKTIAEKANSGKATFSLLAK